MPQPARREAICRESGRSSAPRQRPGCARVRAMGPEGPAAPPILPGPPAAARISKAALCGEPGPWSLVCRGGGGSRNTVGRPSPPRALLAGVPRVLGPRRMVNTWVAASASPGSRLCPGAQVSFLGGPGPVSWLRWLVQWRLRGLLGWGSCPSKERGGGCAFGLPAPSLCQHLPFGLCEQGAEPGKPLPFLKREAVSWLCEEPVLFLAATLRV